MSRPLIPFRLSLICLLLLVAAASAPAGSENTSTVARMSGPERLQLDNLRSLDPALLGLFEEQSRPEVLAARTRDLLALDLPGIGSRSENSEGRAPIHAYIDAVAAALEEHGLERLGSFRQTVAAPVSLDRRLNPDLREAPAHIDVDGRILPVHALWPNGPMPSLVPTEGLSGHLVDCGSGSWKAINGLSLEGAIALLDFRGAENMSRLFALGAQAVIILEDPFVQYELATTLFGQTPTPLPRFYAETVVAKQLREAATNGSGGKLSGGQIYEDRTIESLFYRLPAPEKIHYRVPDNFLLRWLSAEFGTNASEIEALNADKAGEVTPGQIWKLPGNASSWTVPADGIWGQVASLLNLPVEALKAANSGQADSILMPGTELLLPREDVPLLLLVSIDATSVVPDLPHGALRMANVATTLQFMETLSRLEDRPQRRDVIFGFIDGDTLGGQGSRLIAEFLYRIDNTLGQRTAEAGADAMLQRYAASLDWFAQGTLPEDIAVRRWLSDEWLRPRFEERRILLAEQRIDRLTGARGSEDLPPIEAIQADLNRVAELRDATLGGFGDETTHLEQLNAAWNGPEAADLERFGLDRQTLQARFLAEYTEELRATQDQRHNAEAALRLRAAIRPSSNIQQPALAWRLDLSDQSASIGSQASAKADQRLRLSPMGQTFSRNLSTRLRKVAAFAADEAAWKEDFTFLSQEDRARIAFLDTNVPLLYDDLWLHADSLVLPLGGENDPRDRIDTPRDTAEAINWEAFSVQARTAMVILAVGAENPIDSRVQGNLRKRELARIEGKTVQFNIRSGIDARDPVAGTYVYLPLSTQAIGWTRPNADIFYGYRRGVVVRSLMSGSYRMPVEVASLNPRPRIYAYKLDRERALFTKVATQGQVGTKPQRNEFAYRAGESVEKNLVLIDVYPRVTFLGVDPSSLNSVLGSMFSNNVISLVDAVTQGNPRDFAIDNPLVDFRETGTEAVTLYLPEGDRVRASIQQGLEYTFILMGPIELDGTGEVVGRGFRVGPDPETGARNLLLPLTPYAIASGMWQLADNRLGIYEDFGIRSRALREAVDKAGELVRQAEQAKAEERWQEAVGHSREAWGILVKNFPKVLKLGREAVFSVILLMALAVPGAWFLERLLIGSKGIVARLGGICAIFILGTTFLNFFHPAFEVALSPFIIVIAFTMILMSAIVLALAYGRFEVVLRRFRSAGGEVQGEEISFMSSLATAFSLGISNLKKRLFRTGLTIFTVTALTFSIVGFVAVSGKDSLNRVPVPLDPDVEGRVVDPLPPAYDGILIREHNWREMQPAKVSSLRAEFGARFPVVARGHYLEAEGGNSAAREGVNQFIVRHGRAESVVNAISFMEPAESAISGLDRAVGNGLWFRSDAEGTYADREVVILPDVVAGRIGIEAGDLIDADGQRLPLEQLPMVRLLERDWRVVGILDTEQANRIRDVNGKSLSVVDFLKSGMATNTAPGELIAEGPSYHMDWSRVAILPMNMMREVGGKPRSVAVKLPEGTAVQDVLDALALRLRTEFFAASDGQVSMVVPRSKVDLAGVAKIFLPVILCILIVMNTMLGTVEERKGEVGMLGAIGLSPRQIAFLMFSESTVFSVLGILLGTFGGLLFANIVNGINAAGGQFLTSLSFNFTSMISMALATGTGLVVLLATLIPASKAAALAAPSGMSEWQLPDSKGDGRIAFRLPFTLTRGNAVGMAAFFQQFLINHNDPTSEDFNCRDIRLSGLDGTIRIETDMWLAPYDLDVAQHFSVRLSEGEREGVFVVDLELVRFSGSEENSRRTAYNLLNLVRKQFLLWRNLQPEERARYIAQGAHMLQQPEPVA